MTGEELLSIFRPLVPGRLDEIAAIYGDVVSRHVLAAVGDGHLYDNADIVMQAAWLGEAFALPVSVRFPGYGIGDEELEQIRTRAALFQTPHGVKALDACGVHGFLRTMLTADLPTLLGKLAAADGRIASLESRLREQPITVLARAGAGLRERE